MGEHDSDRPASAWFDSRDDFTTNPIAYLPADPAAEPVEPEQTAVTAGEQDHSDPWAYAGEPADPPGRV